VERHWFHKNRVIFKLKGIDTIDQAEALVGDEVQISASEAAPLDKDAFFIHDLIGCSVVDVESGRKAGTVVEVTFASGSAPLLVLESGTQPQHEHMIPFATEHLEQVDTVAKIIRMRLPRGILEVHRADYDDASRPPL